MPSSALLRGASAGVLTLVLVSIPALAQESLPPILIGAQNGAPNQNDQSNRAPAAANASGPITQTPDPLDTPMPTASRLDLTPRETPAAVYTMDNKEMTERGFILAQDAVASLPGVTVGNSPIDPSAFSMRGFTYNQITVLRDGIYLGPSGFINRPQNIFNLESVEVLAGPASVLYGQGAVGGAINYRTRDPLFGPTKVEAFATGGSFGTAYVGAGINTKVTDDVAALLYFSRSSSSGYVHNASSDSLDVTASVLWKPTEDFSAKFGIDYLNDDLPDYYGTPLIPGNFAMSRMGGVISTTTGQVLDQTMRFNDYNVSNALLRASQILPTAVFKWKPTSDITIDDTAYYYFADRKWQNAETYTFLTASGKDSLGNPIPAGAITRDRFYVFHDQHNYGNTLTATYAHKIFNMDNKFLLGSDLSTIHFLRDSGSASGTPDWVNPWDPNQGVFGAYRGLYPITRRPTRIDDYAGLFEDALSILPQLKLVTGGRYDFERLDRVNYSQLDVFNATTSFRRNFHPWNFRVGAVYDITPDLSVYGQYTTAQDPIGSPIFTVNATQNFNLSSSRQGEIGAKATFQDGKGDATLALYRINRSNILTETAPPSAANNVSNIGSQYSNGVEFQTHFLVTPQWKVSLNAAYVYARYGYFYDPSAGVLANGNRPFDVPTWTANMFTKYSKVADLPLDLGLNLRYVGDRAANTANTVYMSGYLLVDVNATYHLTQNIDAMFQINNLFDKAYAQWAEITYPNEIILGAPRSFNFTLSAKF